MADTRQRTTWGNRFRFLIRTAGLSGVIAVVVAVGLIAATLPNLNPGSWTGLKAIPDQLHAASNGDHGAAAKVAAWMLAGGFIAVVLALLVEVLGALFLGVGRRTAAGTVATVGAVAAVVLLVLVNVYSFTHHRRFDCTRDERFTLPPELVAELGKLRGNAPTTIVVHQTHNFGPLMPTRDSFTKAAEAEVTAKVKDLVDQFRAFGPQFKVVVLDKEAFEYRRELEELTKDAPELGAAINAAPENSIFFHANKRVQRLSFNEFMQLDRTASEQADGGRANLVLIPQGIDTFARRILTVQERRPKVAVVVVHELLTTSADDPKNRFSMNGVKKSLTAQGFDVVDIVLKKGWASARSRSDLKPAADNREESKLEWLEGELDDADAEVASARAEVAQFEAVRGVIEKVKDKPWDERRALYLKLTRRTLTEDQEPQLLAAIEKSARRAQDDLKEAIEKQKEAEKRVAEALKDERPLQDRRMSDVSAKLTKQLADVDLLIVPRFTTEDAMEGPGVDASLHALSKEQAKVVKEFMKQGKPVLACLGPITPQVTPRTGAPPEEFEVEFSREITGASDDFEKMLAERGIELGRSVILFDGETKALARDSQFGGRPVDVPAIVLTDTAPANSKLRANPIAAAFRLTGRTAEQTPAGQPDTHGATQPYEIKLRAVRPVTLPPEWQTFQPFAAEIAFTAPESWSELQPYPRFGRRPDGTRALVYVPKYEPTGLDDTKKGTRDEEKRGPFSIGVAVESKIPATWVKEGYQRERFEAANLAPTGGLLGGLLRSASRAPVAAWQTVTAEKVERTTQRTVVFGSGNLFNGAELKPAQEKLLLHTLNWLTNREDRLPRPATDRTPAWSYPRVAMSDSTRLLWQWGGWLGPPLVVAYVGLLVMLIRRMR